MEEHDMATRALNRPQTRNKADRIEARVSSEMKALCQRAAAIQGRSLTDFVIHSSVEAAQRTIRDNEYLDLNRRDRLAFLQAVLDPPPPGSPLKRAAKHYRQMLEQ